MPKSVPNRSVSLSVISWNVRLSATRSASLGSSTPIFWRLPVRLKWKSGPPSVSSVEKPTNRSFVYCGPTSKADQAHQVRLLAAELGEYGIRVNGVNPDGVVRGSGIFAKGWGADRARTYGIPEDKLGEFYAQRTLLKREVLPEHVAAAVFALTGGDLSQTTGLHIPVDAGVAAAFLR